MAEFQALSGMCIREFRGHTDTVQVALKQGKLVASFEEETCVYIYMHIFIYLYVTYTYMYSFKKNIYIYIHLEPQTPSLKWMFGETTISCVKIWNHPIEITIYIWLAFGVPGIYI